MTTTIEAPPATEAAVERIDEHLAAMPSGRSLIDVTEHVDVLLDLRLLFTKETP
jgi:hypothetical protein